MVRVASLRICWDSNCFIAYLSEEPGRVEVCESILRAAERGEVETIRFIYGGLWKLSVFVELICLHLKH